MRSVTAMITNLHNSTLDMILPFSLGFNSVPLFAILTRWSCDHFMASWKVNLSKRFQCEGNRSNFCQYNKCKCQEELAYQFSTLLTEFDESHVTNRDGGFDVTTCRTNNGAASGSVSGAGSSSQSSSNSEDMVCCGHYPKRFTFNTQNGNRACCEAEDETGVTYNSNLYECCSGSLSSIGSCTI